MRRADRLFEILQLLHGGRLRRAQELAAHLEVSTRTIYRDIADLMASGVPIEGEAGVGYVLRPGFFLPPLALSATEHEALVLGARLVAAWSDTDLAAAAKEALIKLEAIGAVAMGARPPVALHSYGGRLSPEVRVLLRQIREALGRRRKLDLLYAKADSPAEARRVRPLSLEFWGMVWTLTAWCEQRSAFRVFRLDRIQHLTQTNEGFDPEPGKTLADYLKSLNNAVP
ncbi:MAG: helix-turn-helix transcriptional regulator [Elstera sp.]